MRASILQRVPALLAAITALGLAARLAGLGSSSLWFDEAFTWLAARQPAWTILTGRLEPFLPPLYHLLLHYWLVLGESEVVLRWLSLLLGVATIPVVAALGRRIFDPATGLGGALLCAVLPFQIYFSQEVRFYSLAILVSSLTLWAYVNAWQTERRRDWLIYGVLAGLSLHVHYFAVLTLLVLQGFAFLNWKLELRRWRGLLFANMVTAGIAIPLLPSAWEQTRLLTTSFWLTAPSPLEPLKALDFLLFGHTTPLWLVPVALFLTLSILMLLAVVARRAVHRSRTWLCLLFALVLVPMLLALAISWTVSPIFLDRSFSVVTPAYICLLSWGFVHAPQRSPLRALYAGLFVVILVSLGNHYLNANPAKPPFREVGVIVKQEWQAGDLLLNLHDSSYLSLRYYVPKADNYLLNNDPNAWLPAHTWAWAGRRVTSPEELPRGARLWLVIMPARLNEGQRQALAGVELHFQVERGWTWNSPEPVELCLYRAAGSGPEAQNERDQGYEPLYVLLNLVAHVASLDDTSLTQPPARDPRAWQGR